MSNFTWMLTLALLCSNQLFAQSIERAPAAAFQVEQLSGAQQEAFRLTGVEKVADFTELLEKYQDKSLNPEIRNQCKIMLLDLFESKENKVFYFDNNQRFKHICLIQFLEAIPKLKRPLEVRQSEGNELSLPIGNSNLLKSKIELFYTHKTKKETVRQVELEVIFKKEIKRFGTNEIEVWQVVLGNMALPDRP